MEIFTVELRRAREDAGLSQDELSQKINYSQSLISAVESGVRTASRDFAARCDDALKTSGLLARLLDYCLKVAVTPPGFRPWLEIERHASSLRAYGPLLVPGLLQTEAYARALLGEDARVSARIERQSVLGNLDSFVVVIDEGVLNRPIGGPDVMIEQIERLIDDRRAVVHVVPAEVGSYSGLDGAFVLALTEGSEVAVLDNGLGGQVVELPEPIAVVRRMWEEVRSEALPRRQSTEILKDAIDRWKSSGGASPADQGPAAESASK